MKNTYQYVVLSLELHLFFARIMKEHSLFLEAGFTPPNADFAKEAEDYKNGFEDLLLHAVKISNGMIRPNVLNSGEIVTEFTLGAEQETQRLTGIAINTEITQLEYQLECSEKFSISPELIHQVKQLNQRAINLLNGLIEFKERIICNVLSCNMFTMNYPLLIKHILREATLYRTYVMNYELKGNFDVQTMKQTELFWNQIMMEHAMFIRGLLDPTEGELIKASNEFAIDYACLLGTAKEMNDKTMMCNAEDALEETVKFRDFKAAGAKGLLECQIQSIILPLLADHVLREANHYIRLLNE